MSKPLIFISNDDGIWAPGIKALVEVAKNYGEVIVVAPDKPQSGQGHAVTIKEPIRLTRVDAFSGVESWECSGTPADSVKLAKDKILKDRKVDLVLSGINHGSNASINIIYSGTMSAAMEGALEGLNSIGFSLDDYSHDADFSGAKVYAGKVIEMSLDNKFNGTFLLNVNIPRLKNDEIKGIKVCRQSNGKWVEEFMEATDPRGVPYYWMTGKFENLEPEATDTDLWAIKNGYVSIVPSCFDLTNHSLISKLNFFSNE
ncbi:MAG: 5'/3'-nucleotidase SurE [Deltaproteobacteria bacterium]